MSIKNSFIILLISIVFFSCESDYKFKLETPNKLKINKVLEISLTDKNNNPIKSVQFSIDNQKIESTSDFSTTLNISDYKLGRHSVSALVFYGDKTKKITNTVFFLADTEPAIYDYKIINEYPHDINAYTQGLEIHNGFLYESTGQYGASSLRKVELKTGKVVQKIDLDKQYFGEGMTRFGNEIIFLTWRKGIGLVYDFETFEQKGTFKYKNSLEGWGLTNNGEKLLKSEGTERIWFLNSETKAEESFIEAYTSKRKVERLNELEYIDGKIYANIYQQNSLLIVDAVTGKVDGIANLNGLRDKVTQHAKLDVLNGIAYDKSTKKLYVTGKNWDKLFEIELVKRQ